MNCNVFFVTWKLYWDSYAKIAFALKFSFLLKNGLLKGQNGKSFDFFFLLRILVVSECGCDKTMVSKCLTVFFVRWIKQFVHYFWGCILRFVLFFNNFWDQEPTPFCKMKGLHGKYSSNMYYLGKYGNPCYTLVFREVFFLYKPKFQCHRLFLILFMVNLRKKTSPNHFSCTF